jgi:hypothetical protein
MQVLAIPSSAAQGITDAAEGARSQVIILRILSIISPIFACFTLVLSKLMAQQEGES